MLKQKVVLYALSVVTALSLYVGHAVATDSLGYSDVASATQCSTGNGGGGC